jgi:diaminohydroxyphosphoribosylaminopyrimidine deaminase / 5-amino-6-(5-phosphoribosylamino)uracil reductase
MVTTDRDIELTRRALDLAAAGVGLVSPNPLVGCVIVDPNGEIVGEGTYRFDEVTHAEVTALELAGSRSQGGTAYVSLEPHSHHGKTPPCTEALIQAGIRRVVCPIQDPNPLVSGKGFDRLRVAGIEVVTGILAEEATRQNEKFICWHVKKRPFVHLKLAMSLDGRISLRSSMSTALSGSQALERVHAIRHEHDAILVGGNTAFIDDPQLTDRSGLARRRPLVRVLLDNRLRIGSESAIASTARMVSTIVFTNSTDEESIRTLEDTGIEICRSEFGGRDLTRVLAELRSRDIQSVLVEGGAEIAGAFLDAGLVDKVTFIYAPLVIGGIEAPNAIGGSGVQDLSMALKLTDVSVRELGHDIEITGYPIG